MTRPAITASLTLALAALILAPWTPAAGTSTAGDQELAKFSADWDKVNTYTCTITAHEVSGTNVQDRVYEMWFQKPHNTRMNITAGDGQGSAVIWDGSDRVYGHQGGWKAMFKKHLNLHDRLATSIRGTTVAEANFGAILDHIRGLKGATIGPTRTGTQVKIDVAVADPTADNNVTREMIVLGDDALPVEYDQWEGDSQVKHVAYTGVQLNIAIDQNLFTRL
jgi:outer membrane lipoprotein-sorting protein